MEDANRQDNDIDINNDIENDNNEEDSDIDEDIENNHWFGTYSYGNENRWGYLITTFFGNQNGEGQYHKNAYSKGKIYRMLGKIGFFVELIEEFRWKVDRDYMLQVRSKKK